MNDAGQEVSVTITSKYTYSYEFTFNEDGTCNIDSKKKNVNTDEIKNIEETGRWDWIDSNEEKVGIYISGDYGENYIQIFIETLSRKELVVNFEHSLTSKIIDKIEDYSSCEGNDVALTTTIDNLKTSSGTKTFTKGEDKEESDDK